MEGVNERKLTKMKGLGDSCRRRDGTGWVIIYGKGRPLAQREPYSCNKKPYNFWAHMYMSGYIHSYIKGTLAHCLLHSNTYVLMSHCCFDLEVIPGYNLLGLRL